ncbi:MAG: hypothetical protein SXG53_28440 [Pseudomonadota bacterium]|nr:hypothetical protein [Pseudomonadota bacterium]
MTEDPKKNPALKDVAPGSDADETPSSEIGETALNPNAPKPNERAAAMKGNKKPGPADAPVQVRPAGAEAQASTGMSSTRPSTRASLPAMPRPNIEQKISARADTTRAQIENACQIKV